MREQAKGTDVLLSARSISYDDLDVWEKLSCLPYFGAPLSLSLSLPIKREP